VITVLLVILILMLLGAVSRVDDTGKASSDLTINNSLLSVVPHDLLDEDLTVLSQEFARKIV
jgi:hypothetical protein